MNILICGDSFSSRKVFQKSNESNLWCSYFEGNHHVSNISTPGQSNYKIFVKTANELISNRKKYQLVIIQWSSLFRLTFNEGKSIYENPVICNLPGCNSLLLSDFHSVWTKNYLHGYIELSEFLTLVASLTSLLHCYQIPFIFIKTFDNYISDLKNIDWKICSTDYAESILYKHQLPDTEIDTYHRKLHNLYILLEELTKKNWINLHSDPWFEQIIDYADDGQHPGVKTNEIFYHQVNNFIETLGIYL